ncbi:MAG: molybdopterin-dependent oxidoreductase [Desulfuromonadaceae bacterium]
MPKLIIDDIPVEVAGGTTVLEAAQSVDIPIPHFCWHPALGKAGACRVCAVKMVEGPVKGIQMSCMLPAQEGMVVSTTDPEAVAVRRNVIEWLMINHPHDCPVCDEGGECQLQDFTIAGGHGIRRYGGKKRTHVNQYLGPYIEHEMNRCIQCYRCVRFYQEYAGGTDFGVMGSAGRIYYGRFQEGQLESPFSGNLVDICPTGVFTDKTARFRARYWDYDMAPSICPGCSLGCNTTPLACYRELLKTISCRNEAVNDWFICDRGRFTNGVVNDPQRPRRALVDGRGTGVAEALEVLLLHIREIVEIYGLSSIAVVGSSRMTQEAAELLPQLAHSIGAGALCFCKTRKERAETLALLELLLAGKSASQQDVRNSDCIVIYGCDPLNEAPMMAMAVRQAWRTGAKVYLIGQEIDLPCELTVCATLDDVPLAEAQRPVIICNLSARIDLLEKLQENHSHLKLACLFPAANSFGTALVMRESAAISLEEALADGEIKGVISIEADIPAVLLDKIPFVASLDWQAAAAVQGAQIVIPTTAWVEMDGSYINYEGRVQQFAKVMNPGVPIKGLDPAAHPPHIHRSVAPGGEALPASQVLATLIKMLDDVNKGLP